jgi:hypothetical protein
MDINQRTSRSIAMLQSALIRTVLEFSCEQEVLK